MSKVVKDLLVDVQKDTSNKGLYGVFLLADNLANDLLYAPQVTVALKCITIAIAGYSMLAWFLFSYSINVYDGKLVSG